MLRNLGRRLLINVQIGILALAGASILLVMIKNPQRFQASVLSLQEQNFIKEKDWDLAYKIQSGAVDIFLAKAPIENEKIHLMIAHNPQDISLQKSTQEAQAMPTIEYTGSEMTIVMAGFSSGYDATKSLLLVPFTGKGNQIVVSDAWSERDGKEYQFAIGNLSLMNQEVHGK